MRHKPLSRINWRLSIEPPGPLIASPASLMNISRSFLASLLAIATTTVYGWTKTLEDGTALIMCDLDGIVQQVLVEEDQIVQRSGDMAKYCNIYLVRCKVKMCCVGQKP